MTPPAARAPFDADGMAASLAEANLPALVMALVQLTGDRRWLGPRYRLRKTRGLTDNDSGGLPEEAQREIRAAALEAMRRLHDGELAVPTAAAGSLLPREQLLEMMSLCAGEPVAAEYGTMLAEEMGFVPRDYAWTARPSDAAVRDFHVLVIGAGMAGLCAAVKLEQDGIPYTVVEKNDAVGGTWLENGYPGCGVDTPSYLYSYSFARQTWPHYFSKQVHLQEYLDKVARESGVRAKIEFRTEVVSAVFDAARSGWKVTTRAAGDRGGASERTREANVVISAVGQLNRPVIPAIPGLETFSGRAFHSARWPADLDVRGKRVAVIGAGASAMQLVPTIAPDVAHLTVFQRSPQWAAPSENYHRGVTEGARRLVTDVPFYEPWYRFWLAWSFGDKIHPTLQIDPAWKNEARAINPVNDGHRRFFTEYIRSELGDREDLIAKSTPGYPPFGKRILIDNGWYKTLLRPNVTLVTDAVRAIVPEGIVTDDGAGDGRATTHEADILVFATGFDARKMLSPMDIRGRSGRSLRERWGDDDATAYLGMAIPDFPNFFTLYGPNTNLGHGGSLVFHAELDVRYVLEVIRTMITLRLAAVEVKPEIADDYTARVDAAHATMIWTHPGMNIWYRNAKGRVVTNSPWRLVDYWHMTERPDLGEYHVERR